MDDDALASLLAGEGTAPAGQQEQQAEPPAAPAAPEGPARGPDGKFAPREAHQPAPPAQAAPAPAPAPPAAVPAPTPAPAPTPQPDAAHVPISALLDEREKRQAAERRAQELQSRVSPPAAPTAEQRLETALRQQTFDMSRRFAEQAHTPAVVDQAHAWAVAKCDADPAFNAQMHASRDPYGDVIKAWRQEQLLQTVTPDDLDDYKAWKASRSAGGAPGPTPTPAPAPAPTPARLSPPPPPRSLADAPNAGGSGAQPETPIGPGAAFASTIR
jgi:hypothetical protein